MQNAAQAANGNSTGTRSVGYAVITEYVHSPVPAHGSRRKASTLHLSRFIINCVSTYTDILIPLQNELLHLKSRMCANSAAITHLRSEIFSLREQGHVLASLRTKGFLSDSKFQEQTTELQSRIGRRKRELSLLLRSEDEDESLDHIGKLIEYFEKRQDVMTEFEQDVFTTLINRIMVKDKYELEFHLPGGLHFTEKI